MSDEATKAPNVIYLQTIPDDGVNHWDETTWCQDRINADDVTYVRFDLVMEAARMFVPTEWRDAFRTVLLTKH